MNRSPIRSGEKAGERNEGAPLMRIFPFFLVSIRVKRKQLDRCHTRRYSKRMADDRMPEISLRGALPNRQLKYVLAWAAFHQDARMQNRELARSGKDRLAVAPLF